MARALLLAALIGLYISGSVRGQDLALDRLEANRRYFAQSEFALGPPRLFVRLPPVEHQSHSIHQPELASEFFANGFGDVVGNNNHSINAITFTTQPPPEASNQAPTGADGRQFGQEPEDIRQVFLRQSSSLLNVGSVQWDVGYTYIWNENDALIVLPDNSIEFQRLRDRQFVLPITWRYGLFENCEIFATIPVGLSLFERSDFQTDASAMRSGLGDVGAGMLYQILRETAECPDLILGLNFSAPTGAAPFGPSPNIASLGRGFWNVATDVSIVKSHDPVVIFGSVGYRHEFANRFSGALVTPGEAVTYSYGLGFSVNDDIALTAEMTGEYQGKFTFSGQAIPNTTQEPISLRFGFTRRTSSERSIQPFVSIGLTSDAPQVFMGIYFIRTKASWHGHYR